MLMGVIRTPPTPEPGAARTTNGPLAVRGDRAV